MYYPFLLCIVYWVAYGMYVLEKKFRQWLIAMGDVSVHIVFVLDTVLACIICNFKRTIEHKILHVLQDCIS